MSRQAPSNDGGDAPRTLAALPVFELIWRASRDAMPRDSHEPGRGRFPVIRRTLHGVSWVEERRVLPNSQQSPPVGVFEGLFRAREAGEGMPCNPGLARSWIWFLGLDNWKGSESDLYCRTTEWAGFDPSTAEKIFPHRIPGGRIYLDPAIVRLREQADDGGKVIGWRSFALSRGLAVEVAVYANRAGCFVADDPGLVLSEARAELVLIACDLSQA